MDFCQQCIDVVTDKNPACPVCGRMISAPSISSFAPFWERISLFFLYPFHLPPLLLILTLVIVNFIVSGNMLGFLVQMLIFVVFTKYAHVVMSSVANGKMKPGRLCWSMFSEDLEVPFKLLFVIFCYALFNTLVQNNVSDSALSLSLFLSSFLFPASIMLLVSSKRFFKAINPLAIAGLIKTVGVSYIILFIFLGLLLTGLLSAWKLLFVSLPMHLFLSAMLLVAMYFILVMFAMMGYVLYQFHQRLGDIDVLVQAPEAVINENGNERSLDILLQEGKYAEAVSWLVGEIEQQPNDFILRERLHRILCSIKNKKNLQIYSADYIVRLLLLGKPSEAIRVYMECHNLIPGFKLKGAKHRYEMARLLVASGQSRAALSLLNDLHRDYPSYDGIPNAYMLVARIMFEYFSHEDKARKILEYLMYKYPNHPSREQTRSYLDTLNNISSCRAE
ncbi:hypothetical protein MNBD_GAMMA24-187 [hydrothermal vent metagenome]|uniref:Tetratricopeptide repeat protein n=1 Tax=hydrothermal vent metagenome TaxID=652676 RepID=A0A3B1B2T0_9ZZZZ